MDVFPKFIIEDNRLVIGKVTFHKELRSSEDSVVKGGGMFTYNHEKKTFHLYGTSHDFGKASLENITNCVCNQLCGNFYYETAYVDCYFTYCDTDDKETAIKDGILIGCD